MDAVRTVAAEREHYPAFVKLFAALGAHDPLPDEERWSAEMRPGTLFLEVDGRPVAYGYAQALSRVGYVRHVAVLAEHRGHGLGRATMLALGAWLRERGCERWELNVRVGNAPAIALYGSLGMKLAYRTHVVRLGPQAVDRVVQHAEAKALDLLDAERDREIEDGFGIPSGLLAHLRTSEGRRLLVAGPPGPLRAFACFDPRFPGCFPFFAADLGCAGSLLREIAPGIPPEPGWIQLVVERDETLASALIAAGAGLELEILHLEGPLP